MTDSQVTAICWLHET